MNRFCRYIVEHINKNEIGNYLFSDILYSLIHNPIHKEDYKNIIRYYLAKPEIISEYLIDPIYKYGKNDNDRKILMQTLTQLYKSKFKKMPNPGDTITYKGHVYIIEAYEGYACIENFVIDIKDIINNILNDNDNNIISQNVQNAQNVPTFPNISNTSSCKSVSQNVPSFPNISNTSSFKPIQDVIYQPQSIQSLSITPNIINVSQTYSANVNPNKILNNISMLNVPEKYKQIYQKLISKGYKNSWNMLVEFTLNHKPIFVNGGSVSKKEIYKGERIGEVYYELTKPLSKNSTYRPFRVDYLDILRYIGVGQHPLFNICD